jgi:hypothetical protein
MQLLQVQFTFTGSSLSRAVNHTKEDVMKKMKVTMLVAASALLMAAPAMAFHSGGVADCDGCHTMHNSEGGNTMNGGTLYQAGPYLLQTGGGTGQASDACLNCHEKTDVSSYHVSTPKSLLGTNTGVGGLVPVMRTPGGDFGWLKMNTTQAFGGHNVMGNNHDLGNSAATSLTTKFTGNKGPGGNFPVDQLQCSSCHDPHGKYRRLADNTIVLPSGTRGTLGTLPITASGSYGQQPVAGKTAVGVYRILGGIGYKPKSAAGTTIDAFVNDPPLAVAPSTYNQSESVNQTKVAYGSGMSEWCANCHGALYANAGASANSTTGNHTHPAGANGGSLAGGSSDSSNAGDILGNYNAYVSSGNLGGTSANSYESLVPYEEANGVTYIDGTLKTKAASNAATYAGPSTGAQAMCLSCHRAHATGFASMLRYDISNEFMTISDTTGTNANAKYSTVTDINAWKVAAYNDKPATKWGVNQRVLCNKCHAKD